MSTLLEPLKHRNPMQMTVGTVLVTVGLLLILSDLAALFAGPTSKNIRLDARRFRVQRHHHVDDRSLHPARHRRPDPGAASHPDADLVRPRRAVGDAGFGRRPASAACGRARSTRRPSPSAPPSQRWPACSTCSTTRSIPMKASASPSRRSPSSSSAASAACRARCWPASSSASPRPSCGFFWTSDWAPGLSIMLLLAILVVFPHGMLSAERNMTGARHRLPGHLVIAAVLVVAALVPVFGGAYPHHVPVHAALRLHHRAELGLAARRGRLRQSRALHLFRHRRLCVRAGQCERRAGCRASFMVAALFTGVMGALLSFPLVPPARRLFRIRHAGAAAAVRAAGVEPRRLSRAARTASCCRRPPR